MESLCINGCQAISNDGLETIVKKHGDSLRVLEMFGCFNITPRGLQAVSNNCINLISLHLGQCYKVSEICSVMKFAHSCLSWWVMPHVYLTFYNNLNRSHLNFNRYGFLSFTQSFYV